MQCRRIRWGTSLTWLCFSLEWTFLWVILGFMAKLSPVDHKIRGGVSLVCLGLERTCLCVISGLTDLSSARCRIKWGTWWPLLWWPFLCLISGFAALPSVCHMKIQVLGRSGWPQLPVMVPLMCTEWSLHRYRCCSYISLSNSFDIFHTVFTLI